MNILTFAAVLLCIYNEVLSGDVRVADLEPSDAQQYIDNQDTSLKYAPKIDSNVPAVRYLGRDPHNVLEDIYLANQYHGQDGLGGYLYGYSVPDIAKTEKKKAGGDLRGAYNYITGDGQEIKVQYWDDGTGFHQVDNVPKILPKQIEDTPAVKAAKEEHLRIWQEQAERNSKPVADPYNSEGQYAEGPLSVQGQKQYQQQQTQVVQQYQTPPPSQYDQHYIAQPSQTNQYRVQSQPDQGQYQVQSQPDQSQYRVQSQPDQGQYASGNQPQFKQYKEKDEEQSGPPKGFFYSFDYPVGIIVQKGESLRNVYEKNKAGFERQLQGHDDVRTARSSSGYLYVKN